MILDFPTLYNLWWQAARFHEAAACFHWLFTCVLCVCVHLNAECTWSGGHTSDWILPFGDIRWMSISPPLCPAPIPIFPQENVKNIPWEVIMFFQWCFGSPQDSKQTIRRTIILKPVVAVGDTRSKPLLMKWEQCDPGLKASEDGCHLCHTGCPLFCYYDF